MSDISPTSCEHVEPVTAPGFVDRWARKAVMGLLAHVREGCITLRDVTGCEWESGAGAKARSSGNQARDGEPVSVGSPSVHTFGEARSDFDLSVTMTIHHPRFYRRVAMGGNAAVGDAYGDGDWSCDDLAALVRILSRHADIVEASERGLGRVGAVMMRFIHALRANTKKGSRRNISAHYDAGNDFFEYVLDPSLSYSCAVFEDDSSTLYDASMAKLKRVCEKLRLTPDDHLLEIGTGWGGLAMYAAEHYGCHVTTTTISRNQYDYAAARIKAAGLEDRITLVMQDYRELRGQFDKLVSIEMIEAVGERYYNEFFRQCSSLLKPDGQMLIQAITIGDHRYDRAKNRVDFIKRFIFPGSCIPSITRLNKSVAGFTDLRLVHLEDITPHYATTLRHWRENMLASLDSIRALGYSERFIRLWEYYFAYCEGGFAERFIGDVQLLFAKPRCRVAAPLTSTPLSLINH
ncbi:MAG: class I SAM-dependent methyltransferase [Phycisphaerae bacterium]